MMLKPFSLLLIALSLIACHSVTAIDDHDKNKDSLTLSLPQLTQNLDWNFSTELSASIIESNIMEGLTAVDFSESQSRLLPDLAQAWETSHDGLQYTFHLRDKMIWSDGQPLVAEHFVASWRRLLSSTSTWADNLFVIRGAKAFHDGKVKSFNEVGVKAIDDKTLQVTLNEPVQYFLELMSHHSTFPIRPDLLEKNKGVWPDPTRLVTVGPFTIEASEKKSRLGLKRNDAYTLKKPKVKSALFLFGLTPEETLARYKTEEINVALDVPAAIAQSFSKHDEVFLTPLFDVTYLTFNVRQKPFSNPIFRRVVAMSIDRDELSHAASSSIRVLGDIVPPGLFGYESNRGVRYDPDAAKTLKEHSGYGDARKYDPIYLQNLLTSSNEVSALNVASQLKRSLGVEIKLVKDDKDIPTNARVIILAHRFAPIADPDSFLSIFTSQSANNITGWKNKNYDDFVRQASIVSSIDAREKLYAKAQHILTETEMPVVPLFYDTQYSLISSRVHDFPLNALGVMPLRNVTAD